MIITETVTINGSTFYRTYSDSGYLIHGGSPEADYAECIDPVPRTYTETTTLIQSEDAQPQDASGYTDSDYAAAGRILLGAESGAE